MLALQSSMLVHSAVQTFKKNKREIDGNDTKHLIVVHFGNA